MSKMKDITGMKFNKLLVIERAENSSRGKARWKCLCDCGNYTIVEGSNLRNGAVKSCGCSKMESKNQTHGMSKTRIYKEWNNMKNRVLNHSTKSYKDYGKRGISVCDEWKYDFKSFYEWAMVNGYSDDLTIERKDTNGDYCPENCCWIPKSEQAKNRRVNYKIEYNGKKHNLVELCNELGLNYKRVHNRIHKLGWSVDRAISTPTMIQKRNMKARNNYGDNK